jgi:hypothetical protein
VAEVKSLRSQILKRSTMLNNERSTYDSIYRSISDNLLPMQSRFQSDNRTRNRDMRNQSIIDNTGTLALRVLAAGMMAGMTSPARPWFRLALPDVDLGNSQPVKEWLDTVTKIMLRIFNKSNTYNMLHFMYRELGGFGTGCAIVTPSFDNIIQHHTMTAGEYALALDHEGLVNTVYREFDLTAGQAVEWFGLDKVSQTTRSAFDRGDYFKMVPIVHGIEPRRDRDPTSAKSKNMPFRSVYVEKRGNDQDPVLSESGFKRFPAIAPRWDVLFNDTYGSSPGMDALGDLLSLQQQQFRKATAIDYMSNPPISIPTALRGQEEGLLPGGVTYHDAASPHGGVRSAFEVSLDLGLLLNDTMDVRQRINRSFYADIFLMLSQGDNGRMTATEVAERHEEKLLQLGPVLERLHTELLEPLIETTFARMVETGIVPPPPEELQGQELQVEFVSMLAQAQRAIGVNSTDRLLGHIGILANLYGPSALDRFDPDKSIERYSDQLGVDPDLIVSSDKVAFIRQQRAQQQAAAQQLEAAKQASEAARNLGTVKTGPDTNAGAEIINQFSGYNGVSGAEL